MEQHADRGRYEQLVGYLEAEGSVREDLVAGLLLIDEFERRQLEPPMRLHLTPESFAQRLEAMATSAANVFPETSPLDAAWQLFLVHLDEAIQTAKPGETDLVLSPYGVASQPPSA